MEDSTKWHYLLTNTEHSCWIHKGQMLVSVKTRENLAQNCSSQVYVGVLMLLASHQTSVCKLTGPVKRIQYYWNLARNCSSQVWLGVLMPVGISRTGSQIDSLQTRRSSMGLTVFSLEMTLKTVNWSKMAEDSSIYQLSDISLSASSQLRWPSQSIVNFILVSMNFVHY